jgi:hypothetical protein
MRTILITFVLSDSLHRSTLLDVFIRERFSQNKSHQPFHSTQRGSEYQSLYRVSESCGVVRARQNLIHQNVRGCNVYATH